MKTPTDETIRDALVLFDALATETFYGFNFRIILAEATAEERRVLKVLVARAQRGRNA